MDGETPKYGILVTIRECRKCHAILDERSSESCADGHRLTCCGEKGTFHKAGCEHCPIAKRARERAIADEQAFLDAFSKR